MFDKRRLELTPRHDLTILADAGPAVGWGHLSRGLALAQTWQPRHGSAHLITCMAPDWVREQCRTNQIALSIVKPTTNGLPDPLDMNGLVKDRSHTAVVFDGYRFNSEFEKQFAGARFLVAIDDFGHDLHDSVDLIVNPNIYAQPKTYRRCAGHVLAGQRFVLLRPAFQNLLRVGSKSDDSIRRVLISVGGSDQAGLTARISKALVDLISRSCSGLLPHLDIFVNGTTALTEAICDELAGYEAAYSIHVASSRFAEIAGQADLAIVAAGSILNELVFLGVPTIAIAVADNQMAVGMGYSDRGAIRFLGELGECSDEVIRNAIVELTSNPLARLNLQESARGLLDGKGASRVAERIAIGRARLRTAQFDDWEKLLELRNDPSVREFSFNGAIITPKGHQKWLRKKIDDENCLLWVALSQSGKFLGQARVDVNEESGEAEISISLAPWARGLGLAEWLIRETTENAMRTRRFDCIVARIKPNNVVSIRAFEDAGYIQRCDVEMAGSRPQIALEFVFHCEQTVTARGI